MYYISQRSDVVCLPLVVNPVSCIGPVKQPSMYSTPAPGHLFTQNKPEATPSNGEWKFFSNVTVQPSVPSTTPASAPSTISISDLNDFNFSTFPPSAPDQSDSGSRRDRAGANGTGNTMAQEGQAIFAPSMGLLDENEIPEFPNFPEVHEADVDNIDTEDFRALFAHSALSGDATSATSACHTGLAAAMNIDNTLGSSGMEQVTRNLGNGTWMPFPPSIVNLLQNDQMTDAGLPSTSATLDDMDSINSIDEDRLMSMFGNHIPFLSGHPT